MAGPRQELFDLEAAHPLLVRYRPGKSDHLVVVCSGVGSDPQSFPEVEFFAAATQNAENHVIFVSDFSRSWLNAPGIDDQIVSIVKNLAAKEGLARISLLGNSMGGTMVLMLADKLPAKTVISFCPQFSVHPEIVPEETRWRRYRKKIRRFRFKKVNPQAVPNQTTFIIHGGTDGELIHARRFPLVRGVRHFVIPQYGHNLAKDLNRRKRLAPLVAAALEDRPFKFRKLIEHEGGTFLKKYLGARSEAT